MPDTLRKKLFRAINKTDIKMLRAVLKQGVSLSFEDGDDMPVIHAAVNYGHDDIDILDELLAHGADVNVGWHIKGNAEGSGETPLHWIAGSDRPEVLRWFIKHGADVNSTNGRGSTPLNACIKTLTFRHEDDRNNEEILVKDDLQVLLEAGADISIADKDGNTPLHYAAFNLMKLTEFLLDKGAAFNAKNNNGKTPFRMAVEGWSPAIAEIFLKRGANANETDNDGETPLNWIAYKSSRELDVSERNIIELLIKAGANLNASDRTNSSPLYVAVSDNKLELAELLIKHGADLHFNNGDPLRIAVFFEYDDCVIKLLKAGAKPDLQDAESLDGAVHVAASERYLAGVKILHEYKANIELCNIDGETPLCVATRRGQEGWNDEVVAYLVENGANVNHADLYGNTPLFWARRNSNKEMEKLLLKAGAKSEGVA